MFCYKPPYIINAINHVIYLFLLIVIAGSGALLCVYAHGSDQRAGCEGRCGWCACVSLLWFLSAGTSACAFNSTILALSYYNIFAFVCIRLFNLFLVIFICYTPTYYCSFLFFVIFVTHAFTIIFCMFVYLFFISVFLFLFFCCFFLAFYLIFSFILFVLRDADGVCGAVWEANQSRLAEGTYQLWRDRIW